MKKQKDKAAIERVKITDLVVDQDVQPRVGGLDDAVVERYAQIYREHGERALPELHAFRLKDGRLILASGFHRRAGAERAGLETVLVGIERGEFDDAVEHACLANGKHGLQMTHDDLKRAVRTLLRLPRWQERSNSWLAKEVGVAIDTVIGIRKDMIVSGEVPNHDTLIGQDGKPRPSNLRRSKVGDDQQPPVPVTQADLTGSDQAGQFDPTPECGDSYEGPRSAPEQQEVEPPAAAPTTRQKPAPATQEVMLDANGCVVPANLRDAFGAAREMMGPEAKHIGRTVEILKSYQHWCQWLVLAKVEAAAETLRKAIEDATPHAVCKRCRGRGIVGRDEKCPDCKNGCGWLPRWREIELHGNDEDRAA